MADGVGSRASDWRASEVACSVTAERFFAAAGSLPARLHDGILDAHCAIRAEAGQHLGMLSTLTAVAWPTGENWVCFANIGDSRLYRFSSDRFHQLSTDDSSRVVVMRGGRPLLVDGSPLIPAAITKAMGQQGHLNVDVHTTDFVVGDWLVLATDGAHGGGRPDWEPTGMRAVVKSQDPEAALNTLVTRRAQVRADDATVVLIQRLDPAIAAVK